MLIGEEELKNEPNNYGEERAKCYTYFMVQVQGEENWANMKTKRRNLHATQEKS